MAVKKTKLFGLTVKPPDGIPDLSPESNGNAFVPMTVEANPALVTSGGDVFNVTDQSKPPLVLFGVDTVGNRVGVGPLRVAHAIYNFAVDGGAISTITPVLTAAIPAYAIIWGGVANPTTAVTSAGSLTMAIGTSAGSSTTALLTATGKASLTIDALIALVPTLAAPIKLTAAGNITVTIAAAAGTAGIVEISVFYTVAKNA